VTNGRLHTLELFKLLQYKAMECHIVARPCGSLDDMEEYYRVLENIFPHQQDLLKKYPLIWMEYTRNIL